jgi:hypothetical protein
MLNIAHPTQTFPAMQGVVGSRLATYATQLPVASIQALLGHDPRSRLWKRLPDDVEQIYRQLQRSTTPARLESIKHYIRTRFDPGARVLGAFPAISIGFQEELRVIDLDPVRAPGAVLLNIDLSSRKRRIVIDGLARTTAGLDLYELSYSSDLPETERLALRSVVEGFTYPAVIYAPAPCTPPLSVEELGQLFADFNFRVAQVPQNIAMALDRSDIYIQLTERLATSSMAIVEHGGMEKRVSTLGKHASGIVTQPVLLRFVRGACEGEDLQESNKSFTPTPNLDGKRFEDVVERLAEFIDALADEMGGDAFADRTSLHLTSSGWQAIGLIYHDVVYRLHGTDFLKVARSLGRLDWSKTGDLWSNIVTEKEMKAGKVLVLRQHGSSAKREIVRILRQRLGIDRRLAELDRAA